MKPILVNNEILPIIDFSVDFSSVFFFRIILYHTFLLTVFIFLDCSGCLNGSYGCSSECFAYECNVANCEFIDEDLLCGKAVSHDDDGSDENNDYYENHLFADICAYSTSLNS